MKEGTLKQLNVKVGDKVRAIRSANGKAIQGMLLVLTRADLTYGHCSARRAGIEEDIWRVDCDSTIYRLEEETMKQWKDMTPEEKGALLLAHHEGKTIQIIFPEDKKDFWKDRPNPHWAPDFAYRVKPSPVIKEVVMHGCKDDNVWSFDSLKKPSRWDTHKISFNLVDGVVDVFSVKMEKL